MLHFTLSSTFQLFGCDLKGNISPMDPDCSWEESVLELLDLSVSVLTSLITHLWLVWSSVLLWTHSHLIRQRQ